MPSPPNAIGQPTYPGGSKSRVNKAGNNVRAGLATPDDLHVIDEWRAAHRAVLNTFKAMLVQRARNKNIIFAQRHKRKRTIFEKLLRFPEMNLSRMDDVAGCRLIFTSIKELYEFRDRLHQAKFNHKRRNIHDKDKYDYIKHPKETGYRGIHDVYEYDVNSESGKHLKGLFIEIQFRTLVQHAWATAVEVIGFITESQPKFQQGDKQIETAMAYASEILARAHEKRKGPFPDATDEDIVSKFLQLDKKFGLLTKLRNLKAAKNAIESNWNSILIFSDSSPLEIKQFKGTSEAIKNLFSLEKEKPTYDIVLVKAQRPDEIKIAFRNYFSDAKDFIRLVESGCIRLQKSFSHNPSTLTFLKSLFKI